MRRAGPLLTVLLGLVIAGCGGSEDPGLPKCPVPQALADTSNLPKNLPMEAWGTVDQAEVEDGFLSARAVTETSIIELYPVMARAVSEGGYTILAGDNEGFEAEIFFNRGEGTTGTFRLRQGPCAGQVTIRLLYEAERYRRDS